MSFNHFNLVLVGVVAAALGGCAFDAGSEGNENGSSASGVTGQDVEFSKPSIADDIRRTTLGDRLDVGEVTGTIASSVRLTTIEDRWHVVVDEDGSGSAYDVYEVPSDWSIRLQCAADHFEVAMVTYPYDVQVELELDEESLAHAIRLESTGDRIHIVDNADDGGMELSLVDVPLANTIRLQAVGDKLHIVQEPEGPANGIDFEQTRLAWSIRPEMPGLGVYIVETSNDGGMDLGFYEAPPVDSVHPQWAADRLTLDEPDDSDASDDQP